jgi:hypothetical protein
VHGYFEKIFFPDCNVSGPKIIDKRLVVCVQGIGVIRSHPLYEPLGGRGVRYFRSGHLIFDDVQESLRELTEFIGDPKDRKFGKPYLVKDGPFPKPAQPTQIFRFEGTPALPYCWVDWTVVAVSFSLEILDSRRPSWDCTTMTPKAPA